MKIKAIAACGNGMGSSQMIKMKINKVFKRLGIDAEIGHMSVGEAKGVANNYDMILYLKHLHRSLEQEKIQKSLDLKIYYQKKKSKQRSEKH